MTPQAVIFDIGNVLVEWQPEVYFDRTYGRARREALFAAVDLHEMNLSIDAGADFASTLDDWAARHPAWSREIRDWKENWIKLASPLIPRSIRLLRALRAKGVPVFALTNFGAANFAYAQSQYVVLNEFDREYVSGRMKLIKPDPAIYAAVERDCGIAPGGLIFVDDRPENIAAAQARGWQVHLFDGPQGWAAKLVALGLLTGAEAA